MKITRVVCMYDKYFSVFLSINLEKIISQDRCIYMYEILDSRVIEFFDNRFVDSKLVNSPKKQQA